MRPVAIIQARCGSTRLPGKVLKPLDRHTVLFYVIRRCQLSRSLADVVVATTTEPADDAIEAYCRSLDVPVYRGSQSDVLLRYVEAARWRSADPIVRITSDCPLIEPAVIDKAMRLYVDTHADYAFIQGYPRGVGDAEVMTLRALQRSLEETQPSDIGYREHVMTYLTDHPEIFRLQIADAPTEIRSLNYRLCVDQIEDLAVVQAICEHFSPRIDFTLNETVEFLAKNPQIAALNCHVIQKG
jgi:spore coat polysaccharide biosynthesis protein SpsF (cytidylyltransferase family)